MQIYIKKNFIDPFSNCQLYFFMYQLVNNAHTTTFCQRSLLQSGLLPPPREGLSFSLSPPGGITSEQPFSHTTSLPVQGNITA